MQVTAKSMGFYGGKIREVGDSFDIKSKDELGSWMIPDEPVEVKRAAPKPSKETPKAEAAPAAIDEVM